MTTRSTEILHVEVEIGKEQIRIVLVYMKTGNHYETKDHNKKITEELGQILKEGNTTKSNNSIRRFHWTLGVHT